MANSNPSARNPVQFVMGADLSELGQAKLQAVAGAFNHL
jgi:hypothetical protein